MAQRRPLTDTQREILQAERSQRRINRQATAEAVQLDTNRTQELAAREVQHERFRRETERSLPIQRYKGQLVGRAADTTIATATPSSDSNLFMVAIFTMAGLIVFYHLVTHGSAFSGFLGGLSNWLSVISTNAPMFVASNQAKTITNQTSTTATSTK